jgi:glycosyltransferase involved in cell wall biosynthesis
LPVPLPCDRVFGPGCLINYFPRRCGGLNPITMIQDYRKQSLRKRLFAGYRYILTNSEHMRRELTRNGAKEESVATLLMPIVDSEVGVRHRPRVPDPAGTVSLLFAGRMERLKGGDLAIAALPMIRRSLARPLRLIMIGDGPDRARWEALARSISKMDGVQIDFTGWLSRDDIEAYYAAADLLLVPSIWPEPFGLVGPEAGAHGLPAVAYAHGGIPDWLTEGVNGHFAPGKRPTARALAEATIKALADDSHHAALRYGAQLTAQRFRIETHVNALETYLKAAAGLDVMAGRLVP